jgi:cytidylate kinase
MTSGAKPIVVAVDGPAGSGKSSICSQAASKLGWTYLSTGILYRAVGVISQQRNIAAGDESGIGRVVEELCLFLEWKADQGMVLFRGEDITPTLNSAEAGNLASKLAKLPLVRQKLLPLQRKMILSASKGVIADGRDIGTVVFPDADLKIFMTASIEERARRRMRQLSQSPGNHILDLEQVKLDIILRDRQDEQRGEAPLRKADDAIEFDNSSHSIQEAVSELVRLIQTHLKLT